MGLPDTSCRGQNLCWTTGTLSQVRLSGEMLKIAMWSDCVALEIAK